MKFAHIADTHIRNLKYHDEYNHVFDQMYKTLAEEKVDCIIHCGDIAHTKTQLSPEFVEMTAKFFKNLAAVAPTYIILGNHDGNLKNENRQDALTPIVDALDIPNLHLLKSSGETIVGDAFALNVLSVFDEGGWIKPTDKERVNIALYHGSVRGVVTDTGWVMEHGDHDIEIFEDFDFAFLGDIHKTNQVVDTDGRVRYPGSTIQQNHGETNDKGFLIWDIEDKDTFEVSHHQLLNPSPFITIELSKAGRMPKGINIPTGARLRLVCNHSIPLHKLRRAVDIAKTRFNPLEITFLNNATDSRGSVDALSGDYIQEDLRDISVQEKFISEYLKDYGINDEMLKRVCTLNKTYNTSVENSETVKRNVNWRLKSLYWDNLFNFGSNNKVDFSALSGIVGIFGKNFSGKSSVIDSLLYTLYNSTSKGNRKNLNSINQSKSWGKGKVEIEIGDNLYTVERRSEKYIKKVKGEDTYEAKTDLNFWSKNTVTGELKSLNGLDRNGTDKNIRMLFGTLEDFLLTSMASQLGSLAFIAEGSTKRKEILAKFLDLEIFEKKFKLAKDDAADLRSSLRRLEKIDFEERTDNISGLLEKHNSEIVSQKERCTQLRESIAGWTEKVGQLEETISAIPAEIINVKDVTAILKSAEGQVDTITHENRSFGKKTKTNRTTLEKIDSFLDSFDIGGYNHKQVMIDEARADMTSLLREIEQQESSLLVEEKKIDLLSTVPCGEQFPQCRFIKDVFAALESIGLTRDKIEEIRQKRGVASSKVESLAPEKVAEYIENYNKLLDKKSSTASELAQLELKIARNKTQAYKLRSDIKSHKKKLQEYEENKEAIENLEALIDQKKTYVFNIDDAELNLTICEEALTSLYRENGSLTQQLQDLEDSRAELVETREEYAAYDLFQKSMDTNGISLDIIKNKLPVINSEIASVLANIVDFQVYVENEDKRLEIFIKHPKFEARPLEMGSGAEKTIASMAIRMALLNVSSMPKGDIFILDEPGTALDEENMEGFVRILDLVKSHYKTVLLISHLDSLKDCVDKQILIDKKRNFAYVNQ